MQIQITPLVYYQEFITALGVWSYEMYKKFDSSITIKGQISKFKKSCANINQLPLTLLALNESCTLLGTCSLEAVGICKDLSPWLVLLYVAPAHRNNKIGEELVNAAKEKAKIMGYQAIYLFTFNEEQEKYFYKLGWVLIKREQYNNHSISIMKIALSR